MHPLSNYVELRRLLSLIALLTAAAPVVSPVVAQGDPGQRKMGTQATRFGVDYNYTHFDTGIDPWHLAALSVEHRRTGGSFVGRINLADRFGTTGTQAEIDAYPRFGNKGYGYLNAGYSGSSIFPDWRFGAEAFRIFPKAWEGSIGFRELRFPGSPVTLLSGSIGRYTGNYWFSLRPYLRDPGPDASISTSLTARRYFVDGDNYVGAVAGYGSAAGESLTAQDLARSSSASLAVQTSRTLTDRTIGLGSVTFEREDLGLTGLRNRLEIGLGFRLKY